MLTKRKIENLLRENYPRLVAEYGVKKIGLFGSSAKGVPGAASDVDLFVEFAEDLEGLLGRKVDILTNVGLKEIRVSRVAQDIAQSVVYV